MSSFIYLFCVLLLVSMSEGGNVAPGISENLYCEGCVATVKELIKLTNKKTSDPKDLVISEAMENICKPMNFVSYEYSPPKTVKACDLLLERHDEEIEAAFAKKDKKDLEHEVCHKISKACTDVDRSKKPKDSADIDLTTDGKTKKVQKEIKIDTLKGVPVETAKTLSKKDKKSKKPKKSKKTEVPKGKKVIKKGSADIFNVDINDPDSMQKVLAQIKEVANNHQKEFHRKQEEEEDEKTAKDEL